MSISYRKQERNKTQNSLKKKKKTYLKVKFKILENKNLWKRKYKEKAEIFEEKLA